MAKFYFLKAQFSPRGLSFYVIIWFMKAVILCAGEGERMRPLTDNIPKPLLLIKEKSILYYVFVSLPEAVDEVFLIIQEKHRRLFEEFLEQNKFDLKVILLVQDLKYPGTYFALKVAQDFLKDEDKFLVLNGDDIFLTEDLEKLITLDAPTYGLSYKKIGENYRTCDLDVENKKIISFRMQTKEEIFREVPCFSGAFTLDKEFFSYQPEYFGTKGEAGIPHTLFANHQDVSFVFLKEWVQINTLAELELARKFFDSRIG